MDVTFLWQFEEIWKLETTPEEIPRYAMYAI